MTEHPDVHDDSSTVATGSRSAYLVPANRSWGSPAWELLDDLHVELRYSQTEAPVAACPAVREYGVGETFEEAIEDLLTSLSDYHESLESREDRLAEAEANDLAELRRLIRRRAVP